LERFPFSAHRIVLVTPTERWQPVQAFYQGIGKTSVRRLRRSTLSAKCRSRFHLLRDDTKRAAHAYELASAFDVHLFIRGRPIRFPRRRAAARPRPRTQRDRGWSRIPHPGLWHNAQRGLSVPVTAPPPRAESRERAGAPVPRAYSLLRSSRSLRTSRARACSSGRARSLSISIAEGGADSVTAIASAGATVAAGPTTSGGWAARNSALRGAR
jgi:hypothetical protein